jgi:UDP:flavonoid glycosyltransferase YjiC (YdhE family)
VLAGLMVVPGPLDTLRNLPAHQIIKDMDSGQQWLPTANTLIHKGGNLPTLKNWHKVLHKFLSTNTFN